MPKLEDYDDSHSSNPLSANAQTSLASKYANGGTAITSTTPNTVSTGQPQVGFPQAGNFGSVPNSFPQNQMSGPGTGFTGGTGSFTGNGFAQPGMGNGYSGSALNSTGGALQAGGATTIEVDKGFSKFINTRWRPMMAVIYMITCVTDFVLFPILWSVLQALYHGTVTSQWQPLTLQGAGLYHIAMGAILGLAAYGRSQEKIAGKD